MFSVSALFSINYIVSKLAMHEFAPLSFAWLRVFGAAILLNLIVPGIGFTRADAWRIALFALLGVVLNQTLFLTGLSLTTAHVASILITTIPIFTLLVAIATRLERATATKVFGIALALGGALLVIGGEGIEGLKEGFIGALLIVGNCLAYGIYLVISKPVVTRLSAGRVVSRMFAAGAIMMLPISLPALSREHWSEIPRNAWIGLAIVIIGPTVAAYLINAWTLKFAESSLVAAYTYVQPVLTTILAWIFLGEQVRPIIGLAALMIFSGVALTASPSPRSRGEGGRRPDEGP